MLVPFVRIAVGRAAGADTPAMLQGVLSIAQPLDDTGSSFEARINASKAARGGGPARLWKSKRQEIEQCPEDARELEVRQLGDFRALPAVSDVVIALHSGLETDVTSCRMAVRQVHPAEQPIVKGFLEAKVRFREQLGRFLEKFPPV